MDDDQINTQANEFPTKEFVSGTNKSNRSFVFLLSILVLLFIAIWSFVGYSYLGQENENGISIRNFFNFEKVAEVGFSDNENLISFYHPILDINFLYPAGWTVAESNYIGDAFLGTEGSCEYIDFYYKGYLREPNACLDGETRSYSPGLAVISPDRLNILVFAGPTSELGGICEPKDCPPNETVAFFVNGISYRLNTFSIPEKEVGYITLIGPDNLGIQAGEKSVWNKFDIYLEAVDEEAFQMLLNILGSIKHGIAL